MYTLLVTTVGLVVALAPAARAQSSHAAEAAKDEVIAVQKRFYDAYRTCNRKEVEALLVEDPLYRHAAGPVQQGRDEILNGIRPADSCNFDELRVDPRSVRIIGDTAIVYGDLMWKVKNGPATEPGKNIAVTTFVRRNGRWLFASNVSAAVPERPTPGTVPERR
jgi:uncharacterized protein (TIGR02246 family)